MGVFFTGRSAANFALTQVGDQLVYLDDDDDDDDDDNDDDGDDEEEEAKYSWNKMTITIEL